MEGEEAGGAETQETQVDASVDTGGTTEDVSTSSDFSIPEEYAENSWAEGLASNEDVWKKLANSQELIGKKTITPIDYETSSAEDIAEYHKSIVPEDVGAYQFSEDSDADFTSKIAPKMQELGIHPWQAKELEGFVNEVAAEMVGAQHDADRSEDGYLNMTKDKWGEDHESVINDLETTYKDTAPDDVQDFLDNTDNKTRFQIDQIVKAVIDEKNAEIAKIKEEYGVEETGIQADGGEKGSATETIEDQYNAKMKEVHELDRAPKKDFAAINKAKAELQELAKKRTKGR